MTEKLNAKRISLSLAATAGIISLICALLIALAPQFTMKFFGAIFHGIDITQITKVMTFGSAVLGIIAAIVVAFVIGWVFAVIYNKIKE